MKQKTLREDAHSLEDVGCRERKSVLARINTFGKCARVVL